MASFCMGQKSAKVPMSMHKDNRERLLKRFKTSEVPETALLVFRGGDSKPIDDSDIEFVFKQESYFQYLFGVMEPDFYATIDMKGFTTLFIPRIPESLQVVLGKIQPPSFYKAKYEVDDCKFMDELSGYVASKDPEIIYVLSGVNPDSGIPHAEVNFDGFNTYRVDRGKLVADLSECRVSKSPAEIEIMRYVVGMTADAHKAVMRTVKPGMYEYQLESTFLHHCYFNGGCRNVGYTPICASGPNGATLHYGHAALPNDRQIQDGDMVLIDCGCEYHCYDGDLTTSFPANGKFTQDQRDVYETVLAMQRGVEAQMKPGVMWPDMHRLAERICLTEMVKRGFLVGDVDEMMKEHMGAVFMPHGLGHLIGLDTHDVGGFPRGYKRIQEPGICKLRTTRPLIPGMIITCEPGVYFNEFTIEPAMANPKTAKFFVKEKMERFKNFGGVRLEDDVLITETGHELLDDLPRTCEEVEAWMAGRDYK